MEQEVVDFLLTEPMAFECVTRGHMVTGVAIGDKTTFELSQVMRMRVWELKRQTVEEHWQETQEVDSWMFEHTGLLVKIERNVKMVDAGLEFTEMARRLPQNLCGHRALHEGHCVSNTTKLWVQ